VDRSIYNLWELAFPKSNPKGETFLTLSLLTLALGAAPALFAESIDVANHSFEDDVLSGTNNNSGSTPPSGWSVNGPANAGYLNFTQSGLSPRPDESTQNAFSNTGDFFQELTGNNVEANKQYTVTVDVGDRDDVDFTNAGSVVEFRLGVGQTFGANLLRPVSETNPVPDGDFQTWQTWTAVFRTGSTLEATGNLRVELVNGGGLQPQFDNVRVEVVGAPSLSTIREVYVRNPSFEADYAMGGETFAFAASHESRTPHGWINGGTSDPGLLNHEQFPTISAPPDGTAANLHMNQGGLLYQVLGETLTADTTYTLQANLGWRSDTAASGTFLPELKLGTGTATGLNLLTANSDSNPDPAPGEWVTWTHTFETGANPTNLDDPLRIELHAAGA
jgi:hypothetical protein